MNNYFPLLLRLLSALVILFGVIACTDSTTTPAVSGEPEGAGNVKNVADFVQVKGVRFEKNGKPYVITGVNMWYAAYLGAPHGVGDRTRLAKELDTLKSIGVNNIRVLAVSEQSDINSAVKPAVTNGFGNYDENLLQGLDYLLAELAKRDMTAVLYFNNFWQWSGGMSQYMSWITGEPMQDPNVTQQWESFMANSASFYRSEKAQQEYRNTLRKIITRVNSINGKAYVDDATIMSWQLANEPRPGNSQTSQEHKEIYINWIHATAAYIKSLDAHHLVSSGSEGEMGSVNDLDVFARAHATPDIDYLTYHMWIRNWGWFDKTNPAETWQPAWEKAQNYMRTHIDIAKKMNKPLVLEEFGLDRDMGAYAIDATTEYRDRYFREVFSVLLESAQKGEPSAGYNLWAWNGAGRTTRENYWWQEGDDFMGDPPQEEQGMYGVFDTDKSTIAIMKEFNARFQQ
ncbi:mannanase [Cellvibrio sp. pealriver]|uniref:glycoside hydrolase 5 family protein n=1 Tax=Cellvibrio sp. pealriver TaxID=1622269 RepID=UPI00066FD6C3|nr:mannanase [Cellvibrio sp. pealriver]